MLTTNRIEIKYGLITLTLLAGLLAVHRTQAFSGLNTTINSFFDLMIGFGFVGFFIVALIANSSLLINLPYTVPLLTLALGGASLDRMLVMGFATGIGAGCGEIVSYYMTFKVLGENSDLEQSSLLQWVKRMLNSHPRTAPLLVFIWAVSPLPDDMVIMPLATVRYGIKRIALPLFAGKVANNLAIAALFYSFTGWSADRVSTTVQADLALGLLILFVMAIMYQVEKGRAMRLSFD